MLVEQL